MEEGLKYARSMFIVMLVVTAAVAVGIWLTWPAHWNWALGVALGSLFSCIKFRVLDVWAVVQVQERPTEVVKIQFQSLLMGLTVFGVILALAFSRSDVFSPFAVAIGFFLPRVVLILDTMFRPQLFRTPPGGGGPGDAVTSDESRDAAPTTWEDKDREKEERWKNG